MKPCPMVEPFLCDIGGGTTDLSLIRVSPREWPAFLRAPGGRASSVVGWG